MNARSRFVVAAAVVLGLTAGVALAATRHVALAFDATSLPYPDGTVITTQLVAHGVVFSADDSDLPPEYRLSLGHRRTSSVGMGLRRRSRTRFASPSPRGP